MPDLTATSPASTHSPPGHTGWGRLGLGVPGCGHPLLAPEEWSELSRQGAHLDWVVLNVANGPGDRPDPHGLAAAGKLTNAGVRVLGHLDLAHGTRSLGALVSDACRYAEWYRVDGFLLDRCPTDRDKLTAVRRVAATLEEVAPDPYLVLGQGSHPHPGYAEAADQLITFSGGWAQYRWSQVAEWTAEHPAERFAHVVHGVPRTHLEEAIRIARWQGAGTIFFTDRPDRPDRAIRAARGVRDTSGARGGPTGGAGRIGGVAGPAGATGAGAGSRPGRQKARIGPFDTLPGYWDEIVSRIGPGVSE
ncbi:spherulation-specific family 4 protein [Streptomyces sp. NPDC057638]|uniref:spherulation-specific family 4 protein n=1 Tax=Streptomyces sp. NPDC057638 TaxID=3346190 RepID=UPI003679FCDF